MFIYSLITSQHLLNKPLTKREIHKRVSVVSQLLFWLVEILLRMYIVNAVTAGNIFLYALSQSKNFIWLAVISFIVYMFCKPSCQELETVVGESEGVK